MHIAIMGRSVRPGATGVGRYAANLIRALGEVGGEIRLTAFLTQDAPRLWDGGVEEVRAPWPTPNEYARALWEQLIVPRQAEAIGADLYHSPNYILPLRRLKCPTVVTVHDLFFRQPSISRWKSMFYLSAMTTFAMRRSDGVIAVSEYTRRSVEARYPQVSKRIEVVYAGADPALQLPAHDELSDFRRRKGLTRPYILFVGTLEPRKNLPRLVQAYDQAMQQTGLPHALVLLGPRGWKTRALWRAIRGSALRDRILLPGFVGDEELACWYAGADLFVYPSLQEGFGLPVLEAMKLGTPVVTSSRTALPEVVGDAAVTVDPEDAEGLTGAIRCVLEDADLSEKLRLAGRRRASGFSWQSAAKQHIDFYERVLSRQTK